MLVLVAHLISRDLLALDLRILWFLLSYCWQYLAKSQLLVAHSVARWHIELHTSASQRTLSTSSAWIPWHKLDLLSTTLLIWSCSLQPFLHQSTPIPPPLHGQHCFVGIDHQSPKILNRWVWPWALLCSLLNNTPMGTNGNYITK